MPDNTLQLFCPAKLNVFLEVHGKRPDGFHELETVMIRTSFGDSLTFSETTDAATHLILSPESSGISPGQFPMDDSNLILKASNALRKLTNTTQGATIEVVKRIPAEAGLAGGSSNAATTLLGLNQLWNLGLPKDELHSIAAELGSDINFFVEDCRAAVCRGRGEIVEPIEASGDFHFVAFHPEVGNSTPAVFSQLKIDEAVQSSDAVQLALKTGDSTQLTAVAFNRLTEAARAINSAMNDMITDVEDQLQRPVFMSGSGATCFVIAENQDEATRIATQLTSQNLVVLGYLKA